MLHDGLRAKGSVFRSKRWTTGWSGKLDPETDLFFCPKPPPATSWHRGCSAPHQRGHRPESAGRGSGCPRLAIQKSVGSRTNGINQGLPREPVSSHRRSSPNEGNPTWLPRNSVEPCHNLWRPEFDELSNNETRYHLGKNRNYALRSWNFSSHLSTVFPMHSFHCRLGSSISKALAKSSNSYRWNRRCCKLQQFWFLTRPKTPLGLGITVTICADKIWQDTWIDCCKRSTKSSLKTSAARTMQGSS